MRQLEAAEPLCTELTSDVLGLNKMSKKVQSMMYWLDWILDAKLLCDCVGIKSRST